MRTLVAVSRVGCRPSVSAGLSCRAAYRALPRIRPGDTGSGGEVVRIGDLSAYVRHQVAGQFDVMVSETKRDRALISTEFESVHDLGCRFYEIVIVDTTSDESARELARRREARQGPGRARQVA